MSGFEGFPPNSQKTAIPNVFFTRLLPQISDTVELRTVLHVFWALQQKKGSPRFVTFRELLGDKALAPGLGEEIAERVEALEMGLGGAVEKGILITREVEAKGIRQRLYLLNTELDRRALGRIVSREVDIGGAPVIVEESVAGLQPNVFALYENNIGPLTPIIVEEIKGAISRYPEEWIVEAIHDSVKSSARNWVYIEKILKNRKEEGGSARPSEMHDLSSLYGRNIGRVTPIILDELNQAASLYPREWIVEAIHSAVRNSATSWVYIDAILKRKRDEDYTVNSAELDDLASIYKSNIGPLTPVILKELREAVSLYPKNWIVDAISEAVKNSARSWTYVEAILKNWLAEGRGSGEAGRHTRSAEDTEKYFLGKYWDSIRRQAD